MVTSGQLDEDARLMAAFVETRDKRKFELLFQKHKRAMVAYAGRYVRSAGRAEELAQEIFVRVYTTKRYEAEASFKTWLYKVATNVCLNELRRPENRHPVESFDAEGSQGWEGTPSPAASPEEQLAEQQLASGLERALSDLPPKQRAAFVMARFEAMSHEQIALALDSTVPAVKSLIHRALEALRARAQELLHEVQTPAEVRP